MFIAICDDTDFVIARVNDSIRPIATINYDSELFTATASN